MGRGCNHLYLGYIKFYQEVGEEIDGRKFWSSETKTRSSKSIT